MVISGGTVNGNGTLTFNVDGATSDLIDISDGTIDLSALNLVINEVGSGANQAAYILIDSVDGGSYTGTFASEAIPADYSVNYNYDGNGTQVALEAVSGSAFGTWATSGTVTGVTFDGDANGDGVKDGIAFLLGAADPDVNALGLLPTVTEVGGDLVMEFDCLASADRGASVLNLQYDGDLVAPWTSALVPGAPGTSDVGNVNFVATANGSLIHRDIASKAQNLCC